MTKLFSIVLICLNIAVTQTQQSSPTVQLNPDEPEQPPALVTDSASPSEGSALPEEGDEISEQVADSAVQTEFEEPEYEPMQDEPAEVSPVSPEPQPIQQQESAEEQDQPDKKQEKEEDEGFSFRPGLTFGTMTRKGNTWTRFSFRPDISIGKFGVALDMELFMNEEQKFDSYGWQFDTFDNGMESLLRKIYYVRWAHPGDPLYIKAGSLDGITLGYGLIMNGYGNTALYPDRKLLGLHLQLNHIRLLDMNLEFTLNNYQELFRGEGVLGARMSIAPLSESPLPLLKKLRLGGTAVTDINQFGSLPDRDGDNCPDGLDLDPGNRHVCLGRRLKIANDNFGKDFFKPDSYAVLEEEDNTMSKALQDQFGDGDGFSLFSVDGGLPIINSNFLSLEVYSELAFQLFQNSDKLFDGGWGLILPGARANIGPAFGSLEYRFFQLPFFPGHFNALYEADRSVISNGQLLTKEAKYWSGKSQTMQGIFGAAGVDLKGFATVEGSYKVMFPEEGSNMQGYTGRVALGEAVTNIIPKIASGEIFWVKERVGEDHDDGFFEKSIYTYYGYGLGIEMGTHMIITVNNITTFTRQDNKLVPETNLYFETSISF